MNDKERCEFLIKRINELWGKVGKQNLTDYEYVNLCYLLERVKNSLHALNCIRPKGD